MSLKKITTAIAISSILLLAGGAKAQPPSNSNYGKDIQKNTICSFITGNNVNIRSGAGNKYKIITKLNRGDGVRATYKKGNWVQIAATTSGFVPNETFKPLKGWVYNAYINGCSEDQFDRWRS
ncbi:SH3 domain-containing protein [Synechocystis sp. PCC 7509]|uniref:SH3 domain-containing protein n=1 Tax=Synechocystis sp. PCC 7509 TaxID=927677 RepID=UPI0002AC2B07|nr:SH3 domain-containing protein [Synechocystis sp. PCC 7509]